MSNSCIQKKISAAGETGCAPAISTPHSDKIEAFTSCPPSPMLRCPWCSTMRTAKTTGWEWVKFHRGDDSRNPQAVWIQPSMDDKVGVLHWHILPETPQVTSGPALRKIWVKGEDYKGCLTTVTNTHTHTNLSVHSSNPPCQAVTVWWKDRRREEVAFSVKWQGDSKMTVLRQHTHRSGKTIITQSFHMPYRWPKEQEEEHQNRSMIHVVVLNVRDSAIKLRVWAAARLRLMSRCRRRLNTVSIFCLHSRLAC